MNAPDFVLIVQLAVNIMHQSFTMMDSIVIVDASPKLTLYGLAIFSVFAVMTADFISEIRSGDS